MNQAWLSYDNAPPIWLPASFFACGIIWLLITGIYLVFGDIPLAGRFHPAIITLTHLLALGVLCNVMLGALIQILAVIAAIDTPHPRLLLYTLLPTWQLGVALLCTGFTLSFNPEWLLAGAIFLLAAFLIFMVHAGRGLYRSPATDNSTKGTILALVGFGVTVLMGALLVVALSGYMTMPLLPLLHSHVLWACLGWLFVLIMAISQTIIPMFLITPAWPAKAYYMEQSIPVLLVGTSVVFFIAPQSINVISWLLAISVLGYAWLAGKRLIDSRRQQDPLHDSWCRILFYLMLTVGLIPISQFQHGLLFIPVLCGVWWLGGLGLGLILAMLGKITPFLAWLHLQRLNPPRGTLPPTHTFISEQSQRRLIYLHDTWVMAATLWSIWPAWFQSILALLTITLGCVASWYGLRLIWRYRSVKSLCQTKGSTTPKAAASLQPETKR